MDASESMLKDSMRKKVVLPKSGGNCKFPVAARTVSGADNINPDTDQLVRGEGREDFLDESKGSPPAYFQDSYPYDGATRDDFWSISEHLTYHHHDEPRVKLYTPRRESFPIPLKYFDVIRVTHTTLEVLQECRIDDFWNIDGSRDLSCPRTGFTQYEKFPERCLWFGEGLRKRHATSRFDQMWPEIWRSMSRNSKMKE